MDKASPVSPGDVIADKYMVVRVLGRGGMGVVVAARHRQLERMVAIKFLQADAAARAGTLARFEREARVIAGLKSEHVAEVFDVGRLPSGEAYMVMELLDGETLGARMDRDGTLPAGEVVEFALEACEGLVEAHAAGIIHRDIKPDNLFLTNRVDGTLSLKIIDFGISKANESTATITHVADFVGTPAYMAPEQFLAPADVDGRADVWSLGVVLYEALTGKRPFAVQGALQMVTAVVNHEPTPILELAPKLPPGLATTIHACLKKSVDERFASVMDLARALAPFALYDASDRIKRLERVAKHASTQTPISRSGAVIRVTGGRFRGHDSISETSDPAALASNPMSETRASGPTNARTSRRRVLGIGLAGAAVGIGALGFWQRQRSSSGAGAKAPGNTSGEASGVAPMSGPGGVSAGASMGPPIPIGILHSLTGTMASSEATCVDAALLAIARVNAEGGLLGRTLEARVRDGHSRADTFVEESRRLLDDDGVPVVFGCWTSTSRRAVRPVFEERRKLLVYSVQYEGIEASPSIIYLGAAPNQQLIPAVRWAFAFLERKSFFLIGSDYVFPRVATEILKDQLKNLGATIAGAAFLPLGSQKVSPVVAAIKKSGANMILNTINGDTNIAFIRELRAMGIRSEKTPLLSFSLDETGYRELDPSLVAGDYMAWNYFESFASKENADFLAAMRDRFGPRPVTDPMATTYSGVLLWADAVKRAGSFELDAVRGVLDKVSVKTPIGDLRVNPQNQHAVKTIAIGQIGGDGKVQVVWSAPKPVEATPYPETRSREDWEKLLAKLKEEWGGKWQAPQ